MSRTPLNKAELARKKRNLATYERFLPSLDMKRKQLLVERRRAKRDLDTIRERLAATRQRVADTLPMLADTQVAVEDLVTIADVEVNSRNIVGVTVPVLGDVRFDVASTGYLVRPHWVDRVIELLKTQLRERVAEKIAEERLARLEAGLKTVTQRVNLFDKVLIPRTKEQIKRIQIALGDAERAGVVRAKIAKRKRAERAS
ncbi:V/A-type H+-transporting ATPase subunit D [Limimonas halophila]|uniref:V/A-type H+-transporting ATPase subunit D n=1 Tax=Limimonas halophila TaxID=1082479 RepID=A0A1G7UDE6_9PROT|nr:V-type ATP synthase subunit D [Limimonas halophila]SDG44780.1 V/A-type H+-transporting ATPase subunit D [Limimonas halophila]